MIDRTIVTERSGDAVPWLGGTAATVSAVVAALLAAVNAPVLLAVGAPGVVAVGAGLAVGNRGAVDAGALLVFVAVIAGAVLGPGTPVGVTALATVAAIVAWDVGHRALDLGEQLGTETATLRLEAAHIGVSLFVGLGVTAVAVVVYATVGGGLPVAAVVLFLLAGAFFVAALGTRRAILAAAN